jgi:hypothetical protein
VSIPVELSELEAKIANFGPSALLVTNAADGPPHVSSVIVTYEMGTLAMKVGRTTRTNVALRPDVALVWLAGAGAEHCLIVDAAVADSTTEALVVKPTSAVLHRLAH